MKLTCRTVYIVVSIGGDSIIYVRNNLIGSLAITHPSEACFNAFVPHISPSINHARHHSATSVRHKYFARLRSASFRHRRTSCPTIPRRQNPLAAVLAPIAHNPAANAWLQIFPGPSNNLRRVPNGDSAALVSSRKMMPCQSNLSEAPCSKRQNLAS